MSGVVSEGRIWVLAGGFSMLVAISLLGWAGARAYDLHLESPTEAGPSPIALDLSTAPAAYSLGEALAGADRHLFRPDRRSAQGRWDPYAAASGSGGIGGPEVPPEPEVTVLGTATGVPGSDFIVCQAEGDSTMIVRPGESCGSLLLRRVRPSEAEFENASGDRVVYRVPRSAEAGSP